MRVDRPQTQLPAQARGMLQVISSSRNAGGGLFWEPDPFLRLLLMKRGMVYGRMEGHWASYQAVPLPIGSEQ